MASASAAPMRAVGYMKASTVVRPRPGRAKRAKKISRIWMLVEKMEGMASASAAPMRAVGYMKASTVVRPRPGRAKRTKKISRIWMLHKWKGRCCISM